MMGPARICYFRPCVRISATSSFNGATAWAALTGKMIRVVFAVLRDAKKPTTSHEITMDVSDKGQVRTVSKRIIAGLRNNQSNARCCYGRPPYSIT